MKYLSCKETTLRAIGSILKSEADEECVGILLSTQTVMLT